MIRGYLRVSSLEQVEGTSLATQREALERFGATAMYPDEGVSGSVPLADREMGEELLSDAQPGDTIVAAKLDRMFRNATDALVVAERLERQGVKLVLLDISRDPINAGGVGKLIFTILAAVAEMERERIRERTQLGMATRRNGGGYMGGKPPFGYRKIGEGKWAMLEQDPDTYPALDTIRQGAEAGLTLRQIQEAVKLVHGVYVSHVSVAKLIREYGYGRG